MINLPKLAYSSALDVADLHHWRDLLEAGSGYTRVSVPQKHRRRREVFRPSVGLDRVLKQLHMGLKFVTRYSPPPEVHGFARGRDITTNAAEHLDKDVVLRVDLKDFFGTIDRAKVVHALADFQFDDDAAAAVAGVTLVERSLPQGFSTSPLLSNLAFARTDVVLSEVARKEGVSYTRYVDDMSFSGSLSCIHDDFLTSVTAVLADFGWHVNPAKTRFMRRGKPQYVTGLYVGDSAGPHIPRSMKRLLRREVYYASKFGLEDARLRSPTPMQHDRLNGWVHYAAHADQVFGANLRDAWRQVDSRQYANNAGRDWDQILEDIYFPEDW
jgi:RNA-directed DNA polymerase